jgi:hypothetical protein
MLRHAGIGTYIRNVVPRIIAARPGWRFTLLTAPAAPPDWAPSERVRFTSCSSAIYTIAEQLELPLRVPRGVDLFWSPHYNIPVFSRAPLVVTVHDVCHLAMTDLYGGAARFAGARERFCSTRTSRARNSSVTSASRDARPPHCSASMRRGARFRRRLDRSVRMSFSSGAASRTRISSR